MGWWNAVTEFVGNLFGGGPAPAVRAEWDRLYSQFCSQVLSERDRSRLWKKKRPRHPGTLRDLHEVHSAGPTAEDLACLRDLVSERESWR